VCLGYSKGPGSPTIGRFVYIDSRRYMKHRNIPKGLDKTHSTKKSRTTKDSDEILIDWLSEVSKTEHHREPIQ